MDTQLIILTDISTGHNVRTSSSPDQALIHSIKDVGFINPITLAEADKYNGRQTYTIVAGHRRFEAAKHLKLAAIPAHILNGKTKPGDRDLIALAENVARKPLTDLEYADAFAHQTTRTDSELSKIFGVTKQFVKQRKALAGLTIKAKALIDKKQLPMEVAELLTLLTPSQQSDWIDDLKDQEIGDWSVLYGLKSKVRSNEILTTKAAIFPLNQYNGEYAVDLFSEDSAKRFTDQEQAKALQLTAITKTCERLVKAGWHFAYAITREDWYTNYTQKYPEVWVAEDGGLLEFTVKDLMKPDFKNWVTHDLTWEKIQKSKCGVVCVMHSVTDLRWIPCVTQKNASTESNAAPGLNSTKEKRPDWGPTSQMAFAAHKADLIRNKMIEMSPGKLQKTLMAIIVCQLGDISFRKEPAQWQQKVLGRSTAAEWSEQRMFKPSEFESLIDDTRLPYYFRNLIIRSMFEQSAYSDNMFPTLKTLAEHLGIKFEDHWIPTKQVLNSLSKDKLEQLCTDLKLKIQVESSYVTGKSGQVTSKSKVTKKALIQTMVSHFNKHDITWAPGEFKFTPKPSGRRPKTSE